MLQLFDSWLHCEWQVEVWLQNLALNQVHDISVFFPKLMNVFEWCVYAHMYVHMANIMFLFRSYNL